MSASTFTASTIEQAALAWLESVGWRVRHGPEIAPGEPGAERGDYGQVVLERRLRDGLGRLNPDLPAEALDDAFRKLTRPEGADLPARNRAAHRLLVDGVTVEYRTPEGEIRGAQARVVDFENPDANDWLAVNQFTVVENKRSRRPDIVLFVNGLPLAVLELKNAADERATIWTAFHQLQTYKAEVGSLFTTNELLVISDGVEARVGTLTAGPEWFKPWRTISGEDLADAHLPELRVVIEGLLAPRRFLDLVRDFIVFEEAGGGRVAKKMAGYHQFHAVRVALSETLRAAKLRREADRWAEARGGYETGRVPGGKPGDRRIGVVWHTQGSGKSLTMAFYAGRIIREPAMENPTVVVLTDRNDLDDQLLGTFSRCRELLRQPPVQAEDRAHLRELLRVAAGGVVFSTVHKFLPEEKGDRQPALSDRHNIVVIADEAHRSQYDFIDGFAAHLRDALPRASFIGFTGTPIELKDAHRDDDKGLIKVVMTGSASDPPDWQPHIRTKLRREALANRFRDDADPLRVVLVRDMWLTGFDCPSLHTMYVDKPMRGHGLMQAITRVNRVFADKPGGLVVDYLGLAHELKQVLAAYTDSGGTGHALHDQDEAVALMLGKYEVCRGLFHGFDWSKWTGGGPQERLGLLPPAQEHILKQENGKDRCLRAVRELTLAFVLAAPHPEALRIRDDVAFFQTVQAALAKRAAGDPRPEEEIDYAIRQIISRAVAAEGMVDIFAAAGLRKPDLSILSDEFLAEVRGLPHKNLAVEMLRKLLEGELRARRRKNVVQARSFAEMLEDTIRRYQNRAIEAVQVIEEMIQMAKDLRQADARGETLGLSEDELAFYDALEVNDSAVKVLGDETLRLIARELVKTVRANVTIDWTLRETVRAQLRVLVKRVLRQHGYPPDKQKKATETVLEQAEVVAAEWVGA